MENSNIFEVISLFDEPITLLTFPPGQIDL